MNIIKGLDINNMNDIFKLYNINELDIKKQLCGLEYSNGFYDGENSTTYPLLRFPNDLLKVIEFNYLDKNLYSNLNKMDNDEILIGGKD